MVRLLLFPVRSIDLDRAHVLDAPLGAKQAQACRRNIVLRRFLIETVIPFLVNSPVLLCMSSMTYSDLCGKRLYWPIVAVGLLGSGTSGGCVA